MNEWKSDRWDIGTHKECEKYILPHDLVEHIYLHKRAFFSCIFTVMSFITCNASQNIVRAIKSRIKRWAGHVTCTRDMRIAYNIFVGKHEGKRTFGRTR
jgi:hypothetical protein